jgi:hypothetical protein
LLGYVPGVWDQLLVSCDLASDGELADEVLPVAGSHRSLTLRQATLLLRGGRWEYLAAHYLWGQSLELLYVGVGLGLVNFVDLVLGRMDAAGCLGSAPQQLFGQPPAQFDVDGAVALARERSQEVMVEYLTGRFGLADGSAHGSAQFT